MASDRANKCDRFRLLEGFARKTPYFVDKFDDHFCSLQAGSRLREADIDGNGTVSDIASFIQILIGGA